MTDNSKVYRRLAARRNREDRDLWTELYAEQKDRLAATVILLFIASVAFIRFRLVSHDTGPLSSTCPQVQAVSFRLGPEPSREARNCTGRELAEGERLADEKSVQPANPIGSIDSPTDEPAITRL